MLEWHFHNPMAPRRHGHAQPCKRSSNFRADWCRFNGTGSLDREHPAPILLVSYGTSRDESSVATNLSMGTLWEQAWDEWGQGDAPLWETTSTDGLG